MKVLWDKIYVFGKNVKFNIVLLFSWAQFPKKKHYFYSMEEYFTNNFFFFKHYYYLHLSLNEKHRLVFLYCW